MIATSGCRNMTAQSRQTDMINMVTINQEKNYDNQATEGPTSKVSRSMIVISCRPREKCASRRK